MEAESPENASEHKTTAETTAGKVIEPDATWHQHPNGGGWVHTTALVQMSAFVGEEATIGARAKIGARATVGAWAMIGKEAKIGDWAKIGEGATIGEGAIWAESPLYVIGTRHLLCAVSREEIAIGCRVHTIEWWLANFESVGLENGYSADQIAEYGDYIRLFAKRYQPHLLEGSTT